MPLAYDKSIQEWTDSTVKDAENYNIFYGNYGTDTITGDVSILSGAKSKIKFVLNNEPSVVKMFNTLNYEGTQAHIKKPPTAFHSSIIDPATGLPLKLLNINNAVAWVAQRDIEGWKCDKIKTNLDPGTVIEFIKNEAK